MKMAVNKCNCVCAATTITTINTVRSSSSSNIGKQRLLNNRVNSLCSTVFVFCAFFYLCLLVTPTLGGDLTDCNSVRLGFQTRGINATDLLQQPTNGRHLRVCPILGQTCCSENTEIRLQQSSKQQFEKTVKESVLKLSSVLNTRSQRFDDFFRTMLTNSKKDFHEMFKRTYGIIYVQNSYVFTDLFQELENYYNKGQVDLAEAMDNFFSVLYQRMFTVINSQYHFDEKYLSCVADHMKDLKPFDDVPQKLSIQIKRSFVAARTFAKALFVGAEVAKSMLNIKPSQECSKSLLRMQHCAGCAGNPQAKACSNYCINVMKGCLVYHTTLEKDWNNYVVAMDRIAERLLGSFNIEMVIEPIDIKISEAIMNFQENGPDVSQRVFSGCGKPVLGKRRRSVNYAQLIKSEQHDHLLRMKSNSGGSDDIGFEDGSSDVVLRTRRATNRELKFETLDFNKNNQEESGVSANSGGSGKKNGGGGGSGGKVAHAKPEGPTLEKLIKDIRHIVKESKRFWSNLPYQICNNDEIAEAPSNEQDCWNGTAISKYTHTVVGDGISNQKHNPDVFVDINRQNSILNEQVYALQAISNKIMYAYQGRDVEWIDTEESLPTYASGSGSGDTTDDTEPDLPDEEEGEGSGDYSNKVPVPEPPVYPPIQPEIPDLPKIAFTPNITSNEIPDSVTISGTSKQQQMSLTRALVTYLMPLVVIWFGGMFAELL